MNNMPCVLGDNHSDKIRGELRLLLYTHAGMQVQLIPTLKSVQFMGTEDVLAPCVFERWISFAFLFF